MARPLIRWINYSMWDVSVYVHAFASEFLCMYCVLQGKAKECCFRIVVGQTFSTLTKIIDRMK
jgi:hypothetical protein